MPGFCEIAKKRIEDEVRQLRLVFANRLYEKKGIKDALEDSRAGRRLRRSINQ